MKNINSIFSLKNLVLAASFCLMPVVAQASCIYEDFQGWKDCFVKEKLSTNAGAIDVGVFQQAQFKSRVIELDKKQPEKKLTFEEYLKVIQIDQKIKDGKVFYKNNRKLVDVIASEYKVPPAVLIALLGMESHYGRIQGDFNIIDALSTLAYEGRRRAFFEKELLKALQIARNENLNYEDFKGSWAGAMGQIQFMPSSYLSYAIDYDMDGKIDIWNSTPDALASAANYLKRSGWDGKDYKIQWLKGKDRPNDCGASEQICKVNGDIRLIFLKDTVRIGAFKVSKNFEVLMKWNRSIYFGLSVLMIANGVNNS